MPISARGGNKADGVSLGSHLPRQTPCGETREVRSRVRMTARKIQPISAQMYGALRQGSSGFVASSTVPTHQNF